jgi:glycolate oxidase FAD binding subunit
MTNFSSPVDQLVQQNVKVISWEKVESNWKTPLSSVILPNSQPEALICPETTDQLSQVVKIAGQHKIPLLSCGNGSKLGWGKVRKAPQWVVSTQKLNQVLDHGVGDLIVTVQAGLKLTDLQAFLQPYGQFLPVDPLYSHQVTLGGMVATADTGSLRQRYGGVRDLVLGLSFVRWDGEIAKAGGKVVKNVAGYDLMKLFTGSYGTLGIISEITFRLYPLVNHSKTLILTGKSDKIALFRNQLVNTGLSPTAADILSSSVVKSLNLGEEMGVILRFQSIPESIEQQLEQVKQLADPLNLRGSVFEEQAEVNLWQQLQDKMFISEGETSLTGKIGIKANQIVNFLETYEGLTQYQGLAMVNLSSGVGRIQLTLSEEMKVIPMLEKLRSHCQNHEGYLSILDAPMTIKQAFDVWGYTGNALEMMKNIKQQFDPYSLLNPNQFVV